MPILLSLSTQNAQMTQMTQIPEDLNTRNRLPSFWLSDPSLDLPDEVLMGPVFVYIVDTGFQAYAFGICACVYCPRARVNTYTCQLAGPF